MGEPVVTLNPDVGAIRAHIAALFDSVSEHYPDGLIEICYGESAPNKAQHFFVSKNGQELAASFAARKNSEGQNVYVGVNPRRKEVTSGHRAGAADVEIAFFQFADLDDAEAVSAARKGLPVKPHLVVMTGTQPNQRPHFYWRLDEPTMNLREWSERQAAIATALGGDRVIDPPRIMRIAGTINYPPPHKVERGYVREIGSFKSYDEGRAPLSAAQLSSAFPTLEQSHTNVVPIRDGQNTLQAMASGAKFSDLMAACHSGVQWHNNMVRLVAHMAAKGRSSAEILGLAAGLTLPGYSIEQTYREMVTALQGARNKYAIPEPADDLETEEAGRDDADSVFELFDLDQIASFPPPTWLIDEFIADHGLSIIYGDPGAGKSFVALDMALRIANGMDWHGAQASQTGVLYIAGEGGKGLGKRVVGWQREHALEGADAPFLLLPVAVQMLEEKDVSKLLRTIDAAKARASFNIGLTVIDTVSRSLAGKDENGQDSMSLFVDACGKIQNHTGGAVIGIHHSGKDSAKGMRGSTVLLGACDASLRITKDDQTAKIETEKQKDAEEGAPIYLELKKVTWAQGLEKEQSTLVPVRRERPPMALEKRMSRAEADAALAEIDRAWAAENPYAVSAQSRDKGRNIHDWMMKSFGISRDHAKSMTASWFTGNYIISEVANKRSKTQGIRVLKFLEPDQ